MSFPLKSSILNHNAGLPFQLVCRNFSRGGSLHTKEGFTLIEVVFTMAITAIFISSLLLLQQFLSDSQNLLSLSTQSFNEANLGVDSMIREIRNAKYSDTGAYPLELANNQEIIFYANVDGDSNIERVRYYLDGTELKRGLINPTGSPAQYLTANEQTTLVISYVQNLAAPIFYYYNGNWPTDTSNNPLPAPARLTDTKMIKVSLVINPKPPRPESQFTLESYAQIRNLKTNL